MARTRSPISIQLQYCRPLPTTPPDAEPEREGHPRQGAPLPREDDAEPGMNDADAGRPRGVGRRLPLAADVGEEARARRALLGERRLAPVAVVADGGRRQEHLGPPREAPERLGQEPRAIDAAPPDPLLDRSGPAERRDALPREVHDRVHALERPGVEPAARRIPLDVRRSRLRWPAAQTVDPVPRRAQCGHERAPHEPGGAGDGNAKPRRADRLGDGRGHGVRPCLPDIPFSVFGSGRSHLYGGQGLTPYRLT